MQVLGTPSLWLLPYEGVAGILRRISGQWQPAQRRRGTAGVHTSTILVNQSKGYVQPAASTTDYAQTTFFCARCAILGAANPVISTETSYFDCPSPTLGLRKHLHKLIIMEGKEGM